MELLHSFRICLVTVVLAGSTAFTATKTSITQYGITWTFDKAYEAGQFCTGDWWVVGPVTITEIDPVSSGGRNGSMLGPEYPSAARHGFDSRISSLTYDESLNIATQLPYTVPANRSVISSISRSEENARCQLETQTVLTVLTEAAPEGSFRPCYVGYNKTIKYNKSQLDYSALKKLNLVPGSVTPADAAAMYEKPMIILGIKHTYQGMYLMAANNLPYYGNNYGREIAAGATVAGLTLNQDYSESGKELLAVRFVQNGLDIDGGVALGNYFQPNGGHIWGFKLPALVAGLMLNDQNILDRADHAKNPGVYSEDIAHSYVDTLDVNTIRRNADTVGETGCAMYSGDVCTRPLEPYTMAMLGTPEWMLGGNGSSHTGSQWDIIYRSTCGQNILGNALAARFMGVSHLYKQAFLDYVDRYVGIEINQGGVPTLTAFLWKYYRTDYGCIYTGIDTVTHERQYTNCDTASSVSDPWPQTTAKPVVVKTLILTRAGFKAWAAEAAGDEHRMRIFDMSGRPATGMTEAATGIYGFHIPGHGPVSTGRLVVVP